MFSAWFSSPSPKPARRCLPRLWARGQRLLWCRLIANGFAQAAVALSLALLAARVVDRYLQAARIPDGLPWLALQLGMLALLLALLRWAERRDAEQLGQGFAQRVRMRVYDHLSATTPRDLARRRRGSLLLRFTGDLSALRQWLSRGLARLWVAATSLSLALPALAWLNPRLALGLGAVLMLGGLLIHAQSRALARSLRTTRRRQAQLAGKVGERLGAVAVVNLCGQARQERRRVQREGRRLQQAMVDRAGVVGRLRAITEAGAGLASAAVLLLGVLEVAAGRASPGTVVAALSVVGFLATQWRELGRIHEYWWQFRVARERLLALFRRPRRLRDRADARCFQPAGGRLCFERVGVDGVLENFSGVVEPGRRIALVGPSGAGKSTLLALAGRLLRPDGGKVWLDGQDIGACQLTSLHPHIGVVSAELPLLAGSVGHNLRYRWPDAPPPALRRLYHRCRLAEWLASLPAGETTRLEEGGANLSLGQRQRLALARALLGEPQLLLLDEAEAHLDGAGQRWFRELLRTYPGTVLLVSHRWETLATVDEIWHLDHGQLVESGPPARLLTAGGPTARLFAVAKGA